MRIRFNIDVEVSPRVKRALKVGIPVTIVLAGSVVYANVPNTFKDGDSLSAQTMNDNFTTLDTRLAKLETLSTKATADGGYALGATYCGETGNTKGDLSGLIATGSRYGRARNQCQTVCSSPSAHMCVGDEVMRSIQLGMVVPTGWYSAGAYSTVGGVNNFECAGWTDATSGAIGNAFDSNNVRPSYDVCSNTNPVLCCD